jgi:hypothetical protein
VLRRRSKPVDRLAHVDPALLPPRWVEPVAEALEARAGWAEVVTGLQPGPVRDRLAELAERLDDGVLAVWDTVVRAVEAERVASGLDVEEVTEEYKRAKRDPHTDPALVEALRARFTAVQRILNAVDDAEAHLRLLDARLGAAVARGAEVALTARGDDDLGRELDAVVTELGALRDSLQALD